MKKGLSLLLSAVMLLLSFQITIFAEETDNLLTDAGFESGVLSNSNSWKFTGGENWYGYGNAGNLGIETNVTYGGEKSN